MWIKSSNTWKLNQGQEEFSREITYFELKQNENIAFQNLYDTKKFLEGNEYLLVI